MALLFSKPTAFIKLYARTQLSERCPVGNFAINMFSTFRVKNKLTPQVGSDIEAAMMEIITSRNDDDGSQDLFSSQDTSQGTNINEQIDITLQVKQF